MSQGIGAAEIKFDSEFVYWDGRTVYHGGLKKKTVIPRTIIHPTRALCNSWFKTDTVQRLSTANGRPGERNLNILPRGEERNAESKVSNNQSLSPRNAPWTMIQNSSPTTERKTFGWSTSCLHKPTKAKMSDLCIPSDRNYLPTKPNKTGESKWGRVNEPTHIHFLSPLIQHTAPGRGNSNKAGEWSVRMSRHFTLAPHAPASYQTQAGQLYSSRPEQSQPRFFPFRGRREG